MKQPLIEILRGATIFGVTLSVAANILAGDISAYSLARGQAFTQDSASAPAPSEFAPYIFSATVEGQVEEINEVSLNTPLGAADTLNNVGDRFEETVPSTLDVLNILYGDGVYTFNIDSQDDGISFSQMDFSVEAYPAAIPHILNFDAAQTIDPSQDFTITFNSFTGAAAADKFELVISDSGGEAVYRQTGSGTTATIPANRLSAEETYDARLRFTHELTRDTTSIPGAIGTTAMFNETAFTISTSQDSGGSTGGSTGGGDNEAPGIQYISPADGAEDVPVSTGITFVFSEEMANSQSIRWSANVNTAGLQSQWLAGTALYITSRGAFPAGAHVTWTLNPDPTSANAFRDLAGNILPTISGSFDTAGSSGTNDCEGGEIDYSKGIASIFKSASFVQTATSAPQPEPEDAAMFGASFSAATNQTVSSVVLSGPFGSRTLTNLFGTYFASVSFPTAAALETAAPAGNYTLAIGGVGTAEVPVGSTASVPVPQFLNLSELIAMDVTKPFTLRFAPFTSAGQFDTISLEISAEPDGGEFHAPDYCEHIDLTNTATSIVIPANTFKAGSKFRGSISFSHSSVDTNSIPNTFIAAGISTRTSFDFTQDGPGPEPTAPDFTGEIVRNPDGTLSFKVTADPGVTLIIQGSTTLKGDWATVTALPVVTGTAEFQVDPKSAKARFFRALVQ